MAVLDRIAADVVSLPGPAGSRTWMPRHAPGPFRKLDAIAVLTGPLLPAPPVA